jgi:hypothetical protein
LHRHSVILITSQQFAVTRSRVNGRHRLQLPGLGL